MYQAKIVSSGDGRYHATTRSSTFEMGADGSNPVDALLASLCGCLGHYVGDFLHQQKIAFSDYSISADSDMAEDKTRLGDIHVAIEIRAARLSEAARAALLGFITQCHIHNTLKANSRILMEVREG